MARMARRDANQGERSSKNEITTNASAGNSGISQACVREKSTHMFVTPSSYHFSQSISSTETVLRPR